MKRTVDRVSGGTHEFLISNGYNHRGRYNLKSKPKRQNKAYLNKHRMHLTFFPRGKTLSVLLFILVVDITYDEGLC